MVFIYLCTIILPDLISGWTRNKEKCKILQQNVEKSERSISMNGVDHRLHTSQLVQKPISLIGNTRRVIALTHLA